MDRQTATEAVKERLTEYVESITDHSRKGNKKAYVCPLCGSGTGRNATGAFTITPDGNSWKCFACDKGGDTLDLIGYVEGIDDYNSKLKRAGELFNVTIDTPAREYQNQDKTAQNTDTHNSIHTPTNGNYLAFYKQANDNIQATNYPEKRGLSKAILDRFKIGYVENWKHPNAPENVTGSPRLIIPVTQTSYLARDTRDNIPDYQKQYAKTKVGGSDIFNGRAFIDDLDKPIFIVEGEIDALSIMEVGGVAVALGSASNVKKLAGMVRDKQLERPLILALDNDSRGKKTQAELEGLLQAQKTPYTVAVLTEGAVKDPNEMLVKNKEAFTARVEDAIKNARDDKEKYLETSTDNYIQDFLNGIADSVNTPSISTGFPILDKCLDGGFYEGLYIVGAISSLGKTTLVTQIADQVASRGHDVLIFSLEMARAEIMAKSISRHTVMEVLQTGGEMKNAKTVRGITAGNRYEKYNNTERELIKNAVQTYSGYAKHIYITEGVGDLGVNQIRATVEKHTRYTGNTPLVIVDYLQILAPANERATDKQNTDKAVMELKRISRDFKTPVIGISSFNRDNYNNAVSMQAFKESGAIEYSSDILIGLQLKGAGQKDFDATEAKSKSPREIELVILKNRNGKTGDKVPFEFYPMFNYFVENDAPKYIQAESDSETDKHQAITEEYEVIPVEGSDLVEIRRKESE
ncbi:DnaB-like helicase C-terminal domain-containing protein [Streptococcus suis]|uniref:DnaB-like helicase C-terminal domain-containing protein n=1 Tax=Streptococcus suis TaxID=1307 RepID=UPI000416BBC6|nr:DnaB-like helicase C-terminal domain-containing protein [Streptococcus suis]MCG9914672.1 toprim domain-containing protein [Streptococcus suis]MCG9923742.1 toprim domain-containing protein [Streptococcus suis]MCG9931855.1 toprim domain-containing protein [Streptococcus suis]HEL1972083.1 toprim domain-containing protein [Streptococcus suis]